MAKLTGREIVAIIRACKASGVAYIQLGDTHIYFDGHEHVTRPSAPTLAADRVPDQEVTPEARLSSQQEIAELNREQMILDDPVAYEAAIINQEI